MAWFKSFSKNEAIGVLIVLCVACIVYTQLCIYDEGQKYLAHWTKVERCALDMERSPRVLVCMQYDTSAGYEKYTVRLNESYCKMHGYGFVNHAGGGEYDAMPPWWRKTFLVRNLVRAHGDEYEYVMWMDSDAAFVKNRHVPVGKIFACHPDKVFHVGKDPIPLTFWGNAGVFAVATSAVGREFMEDWCASYNPETWCDVDAVPECDKPHRPIRRWKTDGSWASDTYEQGQMNKLMRSEKYKDLYKRYQNEFLGPQRNGFTRKVLDWLGGSHEPVFAIHAMGATSEERKTLFGGYCRRFGVCEEE
jgi:hypothetical protein